MNEAKIMTVIETLGDVIAKKDTEIYWLKTDIESLKKKLEAAEKEKESKAE